MDLVLSLVLLLLVCQLSNSEDCQDPPYEIKSLMSLERSILCDEYNIQSLTEAFFPANRRQAFIVEVHFYVNRSEHPLSPENNETAESDYVLIWFSSSVLAVIHPKVLEGFSLWTFSAEFNYAHLRIAPFFNDDEDWIRGLLSNATIWLKSYAKNRYSTVLNGVSVSTQGFSTYQPNDTDEHYFINNPLWSYRIYVPLLGVCFLSITLLTLFFPCYLLQKYPLLHKLSNLEENEKFRFKFRNLFWGTVLTLGLFTLGVLGFAIWHIVTFGWKWDTANPFIYRTIIGGIVIVYVYSFAWAVGLTIRAKIKKNLIRMIHCPKEQPETVGCGCGCLQILGNIFAVYVIELSVSMVAFFSCGILLALFVDPVQVINYVAIYVAAFVCVAYAFGYLFEFINELKTKDDKCIICAKITIRLLFLFLVDTFIIIFGLTYASIVFFADTDDQLNLFSTISGLLPVAIATVAGWGLKHQFQTYFKQAQSEPSSDATASSDANSTSSDATASSDDNNTSSDATASSDDNNTSSDAITTTV